MFSNLKTGHGCEDIINFIQTQGVLTDQPGYFGLMDLT